MCRGEAPEEGSGEVCEGRCGHSRWKWDYQAEDRPGMGLAPPWWPCRGAPSVSPKQGPISPHMPVFEDWRGCPRFALK